MENRLYKISSIYSLLFLWTLAVQLTPTKLLEPPSLVALNLNHTKISELTVPRKTQNESEQRSLFGSHHFPVEDSHPSSEEGTPSTNQTSIAEETSPTTTTEAEGYLYDNPWRNMNTMKLVLLSLVSLLIPVVFMVLLMWRMRKEKKYLDPNTGALVYRDTIIVPTFNTGSTQHQNLNIVQMHTTLHDIPPAYDAVVKTPFSMKTPEEAKSEHTNEPPPPSYSAVHI